MALYGMLATMAAMAAIFIDRPNWNDRSFKKAMAPVALLIILLVIVLLVQWFGGGENADPAPAE